MERMPGAELTAYPGDEPETQSNYSNGATCKILKGNDKALPLDVPCKMDASFEPGAGQDSLDRDRRGEWQSR